MAALLWSLATLIDPFFSKVHGHSTILCAILMFLHWIPWCLYWWFQGLVFTGIWVIGHECGHGAFSPHRKINDIIGFIAHSFLWTPYFSWKISHHRHHINHASMERDECYVPLTRSDLGIPPPGIHFDYDEILGDTPLYTLIMLIRQQLLAFPAYLLLNSSGQRNYPKWTNHFSPNSILFTKGQRRAVMLSNIGLVIMALAVRKAVLMYGVLSVLKYYGVPWLAVTHWFVMITYLHHTDPIIPHFRGKMWNFQRGAAATVDRAFLGWQGNFFLHSVARYHVIHHFFPKMPFYHGKEATEALQSFIGNYYCFSDKPVFQALWDNYNRCQFVDDEGEVVFYRDKKGESAVRI
ncbi:tRNA-dihydrouridine(47) synthase [NAD(P)(+)] [Mycena sanguinolenta]|uniref:tRNA-dihydrouridine(47) synthase [NAD(P)(+)] n=1 Tax=Mycena sanguinolenta TaxID=230812 RepID=A0A8H6ZJJ0_9AGAR|nr:tRNA-dihydrouridine(47) synthase [NAD(P)(+)] [Mycena sanguinolenta]